MTQPNMPPPSDPTPGFYPDSQGVMRLWDGQRWTEVTRPMPQPATPPPGQPGYYPDSQGVMRWWTGRDWTPHTQPPATTQPEPPKEPPKNWFQRNIGWKLAVLLGIAVLGSCSVIIGGTDDPDMTATSTLPATQETSDAPEPEPSLNQSRPRKPSRLARSRTSCSCSRVQGGAEIKPSERQRRTTGGVTLHAAAA